MGGGACLRAVGNVAKLGPFRTAGATGAGLMMGGGKSEGMVGSRSRTSLLLRKVGMAGAPGRSGEPPGRADGPIPWLIIMLIMLTPLLDGRTVASSTSLPPLLMGAGDVVNSGTSGGTLGRSASDCMSVLSRNLKPAVADTMVARLLRLVEGGK